MLLPLAVRVAAAYGGSYEKMRGVNLYVHVLRCAVEVCLFVDVELLRESRRAFFFFWFVVFLVFLSGRRRSVTNE